MTLQLRFYKFLCKKHLSASKLTITPKVIFSTHCRNLNAKIKKVNNFTTKENFTPC